MAQEHLDPHDTPECLPDEVWPIGKKAALYSCVIVFLLGAFDFIDRQVLAALLPYIKAEWNVSDTELGMLISVVNVVMALLVVPSAYFIDHWSRKKMVTIMATIWSLATGACAFAGSFSHLFIARMFIGAGEAGYNPAAQTLLSAQFPKKYRGTALALSQLGIGIGAPLGVMIGAYIATHWGWRHAFGVVAIPGLILAFMALGIKDYKTVIVTKKEDGTGKVQKEPYLKVLVKLLKTPSLLCVFFGAMMMMMYSGAIMNWLPSYFQREAGLNPAQGSVYAAIVMLASMISVLVIGPVIDFIRKYKSNGAPFALAWTLGVGAALAYVGYGVLAPGSISQVVVLSLSGLCTGATSTGGPVIIMDLVHPGNRATAVSLMIFCQNLLGFALGPVIAGLLSDHFTLGTALLIFALNPLLACIGYTVCTFTYKRDIAKVGCLDVSFE